MAESKEKKEEVMLHLVGNAFTKRRKHSVENLLERLRRNEEAQQNIVLYSAKTWKERRYGSDRTYDENSPSDVRRRRWRKAINRTGSTSELKASNDQCKKKGIDTLIAVVNKVRLCNKVFKNMREFAVEKGGYAKVCSGAMQLKDSVVGSVEQKNLLFNPNEYKTRYQIVAPKWCRKICALSPEQRTEAEVQNMAHFMRQLKDFRKYSRKMLLLLAKIVKYERFGRRRVIVRQNHIGMNFYVILSGSVGIVIGDDEDKAFENEKKPANVLRKGDSFGEVALVQRSVRTATVVCLENTEFLVIDKNEFFELGVDKFSQEEIIFRYNFMSSLEVFKSWNKDVLKEVAAGARNLEFLGDRVIEMDSTESEYVFLIVQGTCDVLRLMDLTTLDSWDERNYNNSRPDSSTTSGYSGSNSCSNSIRSRSNLSKSAPPVYNNLSEENIKDATSQLSIVNSQNSLGKQAKVHFNKRQSSCISMTSGIESATTSFHKTYNRSKSASILSQYTKEHKYRDHAIPAWLGRRNGTWQSGLGEKCKTANIGLGAFMRIDELTQGQAFGMEYLLHEDDQDDDSKRKFILLSSGCEVIRIPKSVLKIYTDDTTMNTIKKRMCSYPTDEELYEIYKRLHSWRCFREQYVDNIAEFRNGVDRAVKDRCVPIPKLPQINKIQRRSQNESPTKHWKRLVNEGHIRKSSSSSSSWSVSPCPPIVEESNQTPFVQKNIITSKGSQRKLVITHGGSRANKFQLTRNSHLKRSRSNGSTACT